MPSSKDRRVYVSADHYEFLQGLQARYEYSTLPATLDALLGFFKLLTDNGDRSLFDALVGLQPQLPSITVRPMAVAPELSFVPTDDLKQSIDASAFSDDW